MTTAEDPTSKRAWLAHHHITIATTAITLGIVGYVTDSTALNLLASLTLFLFFAGEWAAERHTGLTCARCLDRIPTDAAVQATRRDWALRLQHWCWARPGTVILVLFTLIGLEIWASIATGNTGATAWVYFAVIWPWFALRAWLQRFHNRVAPWCPYCRGRGGGGGHVESPTPVPSGSKVA